MPIDSEEDEDLRRTKAIAMYAEDQIYDLGGEQYKDGELEFGLNYKISHLQKTPNYILIIYSDQCCKCSTFHSPYHLYYQTY